MQTQTEITQLDKLERDIAAAAAQVAAAERAAEDAAAEAERAAKAYLGHRTKDLLLEKMTLHDLAGDAKARVEEQKERHHQLVSQRTKLERDAIERAYSEQYRETQAAFMGAGRAMLDAVRQLEAALTLVGPLGKSRAHAAEHRVPFGAALTLQAFIDDFNRELEPLIGPGHDTDSQWGKANLSDQPSCVNIHLRRPLTALPPGLRR